MDYLQKKRAVTKSISYKKKCIQSTNDLSLFCMENATIMPPMYFNSSDTKQTASKVKKRGSNILPIPQTHPPNIYNDQSKYVKIYETMFSDCSMSKEDKLIEYKLIQEIVNLSQIRRNLSEELQKELILKEIEKKCGEINIDNIKYEDIQNMRLFGANDPEKIANSLFK
jgi:protein required for attachment to host cells